MPTYHTPPEIFPPFAGYNHGVEVPPGTRLLVCSGQLGVAPDGDVPESAEDQTVLCFENIGAVLKSAGMTYADILRLNAYVTDRAHLPAYMTVRDRFVASPPPASTLMIVTGFARPEFKVEIEVIAGKEGE
ncbi:MAG: RidA family protein [Pseudomonadota bacterium]